MAFAVLGNDVSGVVQSAVQNTVTNESTLVIDQTVDSGRFQGGILRAPGIGNFPVINNAMSLGSTFVIVQGMFPTVLPPGGVPFTMVDDDDFNADDGAGLDGDSGEDVVEFADMFALMQDSDSPTADVFAPAYIRPTYDGGGNAANDTGQVGFSLNVARENTPVAAQLALGRNSGSSESDDFWVGYVQTSYQGRTGGDLDPDTESPEGGYSQIYAVSDDTTSASNVPRGGDGSLVFVEVQQDAGAPTARTAPHEVGHQFGLSGDLPSFGIMAPGTSEPAVFVDRHLNILRWRVKSPGQQ